MKAGLTALVAAVGLIAAPAIAADGTAASPAAALSLGKARAAAPARKGEALAGIGSQFLIGAAVTAAIVAGIFIAADQIGSDDPDSN